MTILCGTDLSAAARAGAEAAAALAARTGDSVVLTHVAEVQPVRADLAALTAMLEQEATAVRKLGVTVKAEVRSGLPDEELCRLAHECSARLLVVSALGRRSPSRWRLGSVAERVAWDCGAPALVVRGSDVWRAWAWSDRKLRIAVGYDASDAGDAALRWAVELAHRGPAEVVVIHVYSPDAESLRLGVSRPAELPGRRAEIENFLTQEVHVRMRTVVAGDLPRLVLESGQGRAGRHVIQVAERESADVLVVGSHHRVGLERAVRGSVSEDVLHNAPMSVACVPLPTADAAAAVAERRVRRLLVTTDLSSIGDRAIPHAYAQLPDGGLAVLLSVIHLIEPAATPNPLIAHYAPGAAPTLAERERHAEAIAEQLRSRIPPWAAARGIETRVEVVEARDVAQAICQESERFAVDAICMATHGRSGVTRLMLGSVAQEVLRRSRRPVTLVRSTV